MARAETIGAGRAFSRRLVFALLTMLGLFLAAFVGTLLWLAREHDSLAAANARLMIERGLESHAERFGGFAADYSYWNDAATYVRERDLAWIEANLVASVSGSIFDLLVLVYPDGSELGWIADDAGVPRPGALPAAVRDRLLPAEGAPYRRYATTSDVAVLDGEIWHLAAAHVAPLTRAPTPEEARAMPVAIYGKRLTPERAAAIGAEVFIEGTALATNPPEDAALDTLPLHDAAGEAVAFLSWPRPVPGDAILGRLAPLIALILLGLAAVAGTIGRHVALSARELERALDDARAGDRAKSEFLTTISHELRTPMNGVIGVAQLLEDTPLDEEQAEFVAILGASAASQMELIEELLSFGEIEAGALRLQEEAVELGPLMAEATGAARVAAARKGLELRVRVPEGAPTLLVDRKRLRQVVVNLVGNAVKFTDEGHVAVAVSIEARGADERWMRLTVSDTGPGIPPDQHARVFERFFQGDGSIRRRKGGTGLGLSISQAIAREMGGEIGLRSAPGEGSTFTLVVPLRMIAPAAQATPGAALEAAA